MKTRDVSLILAICWTISVIAGVHPSDVDIRARVLHQPLFPIGTPSPPVAVAPDASDQPFFPEVQTPPDQTPPPPVRQNATASRPLPAAAQSSNATKTVAIAASVGVVTLGMLSALAVFLHRRKVRRSSDERKIVGTDVRAFPENSGAPPSSILYIGTMEPSASEVNGGISSSNRKLNGLKELNRERYRPSPELQPLPPLNMPTSVISSSDDESRESTSYHTPHGSSAMSPASRKSYISINPLGRRDPSNHSVLFPHSRRTSPKSRLSVSSPNTKHSIDTTTNRAPLPSSSPPLHLISSSQLAHVVDSGIRTKIPSHHSPNSNILRSISNSSIKENKITPPPPPPPPPPPRPPPPQLPLKPKPPNHDEKTSPMGGSSSLRNESAKAMTTREEEEEEPEFSKPKLKPLHWDKVPATSDHATVWDQLKSGSFQLNEDMIESLFGCNSNPKLDKEPVWRTVHPPADQENRVLDPKKSQNIAILLRALNVTRDEVSEALLDGNQEGLGTELLETLVKMAPTKEEERKLKDYNGNISKLGSAERFLKGLLDVPFAFKRIEVMLYRANFENEVKFLRKSYQTLERASEELRRSRLFFKILEAVLRTGNRMNVGTNRGDAEAFKLDTLLKLVDVKGTDGKTTLLHFVVQEIIRSEVGNESHGDLKKKELMVVSGLSRDLENVKRAAGMDSDVLSSYVSKLESGLEKVRMILQYEQPNMEGGFFRSTKLFIERAEVEIMGMKEDGKKALLLVKEATEYFHGDAAKEEAHPFRIFMIVRDFLSVLDHVCRDLGRMRSGGVLVGSARSFRISM